VIEVRKHSRLGELRICMSIVALRHQTIGIDGCSSECTALAITLTVQGQLRLHIDARLDEDHL
jgi:hypothetical protein